MQIESESERRLLRALVAEDDPAIRRLIACMLELDGWDVREAVDGAEAVAMAEDWHPDALVMDVMMPNIDGITATQEIRRQPGNADCAVVVVSAEPAAESRARDIGSDDFVAKPFDPDELSARTRAAVRWHGTAALAAGSPDAQMPS